MERSLNILICPLEWGLGHASRMIPVAGRLQEMGCTVYIGAGEEHAALMRSELPGTGYIPFSGFKPGYSRFLPQYLAMLLRTPLLAWHIFREHRRLKEIIREHDIDIVISDNRFGLWNREVTTAYVTHMPRIPFPKIFRPFEFIGIVLHGYFIKKYDLCLIPDLPGELNLSGRLSHGIKLPANARFAGILSRFSRPADIPRPDSADHGYNTVVLSGPEPQRGMLREKLVSLFRTGPTETYFLEGKPGRRPVMTRSGNLTFYSHLPGREMDELLRGSGLIVSRSGYTTIMELASLGCSAVLVPTPGQTEQEYLADYLVSRGWFGSVSQSGLRAGISLVPGDASGCSLIAAASPDLLKKVLGELIEKHHRKGENRKTGNES